MIWRNFKAISMCSRQIAFLWLAFDLSKTRTHIISRVPLRDQCDCYVVLESGILQHWCSFLGKIGCIGGLRKICVSANQQGSKYWYIYSFSCKKRGTNKVLFNFTTAINQSLQKLKSTVFVPDWLRLNEYKSLSTFYHTIEPWIRK